MNSSRIKDAVNEIERCQSAIAWLEEFGIKLKYDPEFGFVQDNFFIDVRPNFASACFGAKEAREMMGRFASMRIEQIVADTITNCRTTIEACKKTILDEASQ